MKLKFLVALGIAATLYSCDDETTGIGQFVADNDMIPAKADSYTIETRSHLLDSVYSRSSTAYLGKFTDQDYGTFSSDFLVQINCPKKLKKQRWDYTTRVILEILWQTFVCRLIR